MKSPLIKTNSSAFQLQNYKSLSIFIEENLYLASSPQSPPRSSAPRRSLCLVPGSDRSLPFRYRHGSSLSVPSAPLTRPALPFPILQASSRRSTSCLSRLPHKACCCHSPLRSLTGVANANELPQLLLRSAP